MLKATSVLRPPFGSTKEFVTVSADPVKITSKPRNVASPMGIYILKK